METGLIPFADLRSMAETMARSGMFGKTPEQMLSLMLIAQAEGIHPAIAAQEYDAIQGRPALKGQAALARFQEAGGRIEWKERSDIVAEAVFSHPQSSPVTVRWDIKRAERMGLAVKDNWKKQPGIMLQWRTVAEGVRVCYPACLNRMYLDAEVQDFEPLRNGTPALVSDKDAPIWSDRVAPAVPATEDTPIQIPEPTPEDDRKDTIRRLLKGLTHSDEEYQALRSEVAHECGNDLDAVIDALTSRTIAAKAEPVQLSLGGAS